MLNTYKLLHSTFLFLVPNTEISISQRKWKCHSEPWYFHLGGDFVIKKREITRWKIAVTGFYSILRDFCAVTFEFNFPSKRSGRWFQSFWWASSSSLLPTDAISREAFSDLHFPVVFLLNCEKFELVYIILFQNELKKWVSKTTQRFSYSNLEHIHADGTITGSVVG